MLKTITFSVLTLASSWVIAAEQKTPVKPLVEGDKVVTADPWTVILSLLFVVGLIFAAAWAVKRFGAAGFSGNQHMKILSVLSVGPREKIMLVDVAGKQLLLGVAPGNVRQLHYFERPIIDSEEASSSEFASKLKQFLPADK